MIFKPIRKPVNPEKIETVFKRETKTCLAINNNNNKKTIHFIL